jgi:hypothetical protein
MGELSPEEKKDLLGHSKRVEEPNPLRMRIEKEYSQAVIDKQMQIATSINQRHQAEMTEAQKKYYETHKPSP